MFGFTTKHRCYRGGQQHNFQPRQDEHFVPHPFKSASGMSEDALHDLLTRGERKITYRGDVCTWCGKVVNAPEPKALSTLGDAYGMPDG